jgi:hypothetical protein
MTEPFLHFGDLGLMREGIRGGGGAQRMDAQPVYFGADASFQSILPHDILIHRGGSRDDQGPRYGGEEPRDRRPVGPQGMPGRCRTLPARAHGALAARYRARDL